MSNIQEQKNNQVMEFLLLEVEKDLNVLDEQFSLYIQELQQNNCIVGDEDAEITHQLVELSGTTSSSFFLSKEIEDIIKNIKDLTIEEIENIPESVINAVQFDIWNINRKFRFRIPLENEATLSELYYHLGFIFIPASIFDEIMKPDG